MIINSVNYIVIIVFRYFQNAFIIPTDTKHFQKATELKDMFFNLTCKILTNTISFCNKQYFLSRQVYYMSIIIWMRIAIMLIWCKHYQIFKIMHNLRKFIFGKNMVYLCRSCGVFLLINKHG